LFSYDKDICIDRISLWLDSKRKREFGFISHAHADHIAPHNRILCTPATARFLGLRLKNPSCHTLVYSEALQYEDYSIELHPAGHILGSAQIKISNDNTSLLYTGDFRLEKSRTVEPFSYCKADIVIMETTYGIPQYKVPPREEVEVQLVDSCRNLLRENRVPVVFAYSLGKGQEALKVLTDAGLRVAVDYSMIRFVSIYQEFGINFQPFEKFRRSAFKNRVLLLPPAYRYYRYLKSIPGVFTFFLSGWGLGPNAERRFGVDKVIPMSDHADYEQLLKFVDNVKPEIVYCTHGMKSFVDTLKTEGFNAYELSAENL
jgi:Cft2 family RNA processing exonuclease